MDNELQYLIGYLEEEFGRDAGFSVRPTPTVVPMRSPDLPPLKGPLPASPRGVVVRSPRREYFFPVDWVAARRFDEIERLAHRVRDDAAGT